MSVEVLLGFVIDINFELGDLILGFRDYYKVVYGQDFELFSLVLISTVLSGIKWVNIGGFETKYLSLRL